MAGLEEYDSRDRPFIWSLTGGEQRFASGLVDRYVADDVAKIRQQVGELLQQGLPKQPRSQRAEWFLQKLSSLNTGPQIEPSVVRVLYQGERS
jgi:malonate decarboxylase beta subunit